MKDFDYALKNDETTLYLKGSGDYYNRNPYDFEDHLYTSSMRSIFRHIRENKITYSDLSAIFIKFIESLDDSDEDSYHFWHNIEAFYYILSNCNNIEKTDIFSFQDCLLSAKKYIEKIKKIPKTSIDLIKIDYPDAILLKYISDEHCCH